MKLTRSVKLYSPLSDVARPSLQVSPYASRWPVVRAVGFEPHDWLAPPGLQPGPLVRSGRHALGSTRVFLTECGLPRPSQLQVTDCTRIS